MTNKLILRKQSDVILRINSEDCDNIIFTPEFDIHDNSKLFYKVRRFIMQRTYYPPKPDNIIYVDDLLVDSGKYNNAYLYFNLAPYMPMGSLYINSRQIALRLECDTTIVFLENFTQKDLNKFKITYGDLYEDCKIIGGEND